MNTGWAIHMSGSAYTDFTSALRIRGGTVGVHRYSRRSWLALDCCSAVRARKIQFQNVVPAANRFLLGSGAAQLRERGRPASRAPEPSWITRIPRRAIVFLVAIGELCIPSIGLDGWLGVDASDEERGLQFHGVAALITFR